MVKASVLRARRAAALCAVLVVVAGCAHSQRPPRATGNAVVPVALAELGTVSPTTLLSGTVAPLQNVGITSTLAEPAARKCSRPLPKPA